MRLANEFRGRYLQDAAKGRQLVAKRGTPTFTGNLDKDFGDATKIDYEKDDADRGAARPCRGTTRICTSAGM